MLEILSVGKKGDGFQGPWDGVLPPQDDKTLFRMHSFNTTADVKDKSPNNIAVTNSNVTVGSDSKGSYMQFNGVNSSLAFTSAILNGTSFDATVIIGDIGYPTTAIYGGVILDGRPNVTNGRYLTTGFSQKPPFVSTVSFQGAGRFAEKSVPNEQFPIVITYQVRPGSFTTVVNGQIVDVWVVADNVMTGSAPWRVGRNAYVQQAQTPWLYGKIYYIDFKKV